jgi:hypothetical protein
MTVSLIRLRKLPIDKEMSATLLRILQYLPNILEKILQAESTILVSWIKL